MRDYSSLARLMHLRRSGTFRFRVHMDVPRLRRITCHTNDPVQAETIQYGAMGYAT